jgi:hypothetical protein
VIAMPIYSVEMNVLATLYIRAATPEEAARIAREQVDTSIEVGERDAGGGELPVSGASYDDPDLPDVSLSPAMTIASVCDGHGPELADGDDDSLDVWNGRGQDDSEERHLRAQERFHAG